MLIDAQQNLEKKLKQLEKEKEELVNNKYNFAVEMKELRQLKTKNQILALDKESLLKQIELLKNQLDKSIDECKELNELKKCNREMEETISELMKNAGPDGDQKFLIDNLRCMQVIFFPNSYPFTCFKLNLPISVRCKLHIKQQFKSEIL